MASPAASESDSLPGSDSYTHTESEQSYSGGKERPGKFFSSGLTSGSRNSGSEELEEALLRTGFFMPEYKH